MGGEGHHHEPFAVPDYKTFSNWQQFPKLTEHHRRLQSLGLKDPWIRNYAWLFDPQRGMTDTLWSTAKRTVFRGWWSGIAATIVLVAIDESYFYLKYGWTSWNKPHHHD